MAVITGGTPLSALTPIVTPSATAIYHVVDAGSNFSITQPNLANALGVLGAGSGLTENSGNIDWGGTLAAGTSTMTVPSGANLDYEFTGGNFSMRMTSVGSAGSNRDWLVENTATARTNTIIQNEFFTRIQSIEGDPNTTFTVQNDQINLNAIDDSSSEEHTVTITPLSVSVDAGSETTSLGLVYVGDYSSRNSANDRWIPDKAYVDSSGLTITNESNNRVITSSGAGSANAEANMTFDGSQLLLLEGGGVGGTPDTDADNFVINVSGDSGGISIITSTTNAGYFTVGDNLDTNAGEFRYRNDIDAWEVRTASQTRLTVDATSVNVNSGTLEIGGNTLFNSGGDPGTGFEPPSTSATVATGDLVMIFDVDDSNNPKQVTAQDIADLGSGGTSGTYTPTETDLANITTSTVQGLHQYYRVGDVVTVTGRYLIEPTAANTFTNFRITLPITSNFTTVQDCLGTVSGINSGTAEAVSGDITTDTVNDEIIIRFVPGAASPDTYAVNYVVTYLVK